MTQPDPCGASSAAAETPAAVDAVTSGDDDPLCQCQGCGTWRGIAWFGKTHACWRNEDGSYEEGGTFQ